MFNDFILVVAVVGVVVDVVVVVIGVVVAGVVVVVAAVTACSYIVVFIPPSVDPMTVSLRSIGFSL